MNFVSAKVSNDFLRYFFVGRFDIERYTLILDFHSRSRASMLVSSFFMRSPSVDKVLSMKMSSMLYDMSQLSHSDDLLNLVRVCFTVKFTSSDKKLSFI